MKTRLFSSAIAIAIGATLAVSSTAAKNEDEDKEKKKGGFFFFGKKEGEAEEGAKTPAPSGGAWKPASRQRSYRPWIQLAPLPGWSEEESDDGVDSRVLGGSLFPAEARPGPLGVPSDNIIFAAEPLETGPDPDQPDFENMLVIPPDPPPLAPEAEPDRKLAEVAELVERLSETPTSFLIDPQQLLTEQEKHDIDHFLAYHAREASVSVAMLMLPSGLELPVGISFSELRRQWFGDEPVMLVVYSLGNPGATELIWQDASMPLEAQQAIWASCLGESLVARDPFNQAERFLTELAVRLYWYHADDLPDARPELDLLADETTSESISPEAAAFPEFFNGRIAAAAAGAFVLLTSIVVLVRRRRLAGPHLLPEIEICPRLGAPHAGGGHAVISFGSNCEG